MNCSFLLFAQMFVIFFLDFKTAVLEAGPIIGDRLTTNLAAKVAAFRGHCLIPFT
jgi:hypothetical protein